jgi:hypothetical protein
MPVTVQTETKPREWIWFGCTVDFVNNFKVRYVLIHQIISICSFRQFVHGYDGVCLSNANELVRAKRWFSG